LATLSETNDEDVLRRVNLQEELDAAGKDYLAVVSSPPAYYSLGKPLKYAIKTLSNHGGITYSLQNSPKGMTLSKDGILEWTPKGEIDDDATNVTILISDAAGKNTIHQFMLRDKSQIGAAVVDARPRVIPNNMGGAASLPPTQIPPPRTTAFGGVSSPPQLQTFAQLVRGGSGSPDVTKIDDQQEEVTGGDFKPIPSGGGPNALLLIGFQNVVVLGPDGYTKLTRFQRVEERSLPLRPNAVPLAGQTERHRSAQIN
jgi:hypothetical protein